MTDLANDSFDYVLFHDETLAPSNGDPLGNLSIVHVPTSCACTRDITLDDLIKIGGHHDPIIQTFVDPINQMFKKFGIKTCLQKAYFLAQAGTESTGFTKVAEGCSDAYEQSNYGGYKGRGILQLTKLANYQKYGLYAGINCLGSHRVILEQMFYACDSAGWFWCIGNGYLNFNDLAARNDLISLSAYTNGGFNGYNSRKAGVLKAISQLGVLSCTTQTADFIASVTTPLAFNQSDLYTGSNHGKVGDCFGWGYWHDPAYANISGMHPPHATQVTISSVLAKEGYQRYLQLPSLPPPPAHGRYNLSVAQMNAIAQAGIQN